MRKFFIFLTIMLIATHVFCTPRDEYLGTWILEDPLIFSDSIYDIDATKYSGLKIHYCDEEIMIGQKTLQITKKRERKWNSAHLQNETKTSSFNGITFATLGIDNESVRVYTFKTNERKNLPGFFIILIDENNMITMTGGVYYRMRRVDKL